MRRSLGFFLLSLFVSVATFAAADTTLDFRNTSWGMNKEQVKAAEKGAIEEEIEDCLVYKGKIGNYNCYIHYFFTVNKLYRAMYQIIGNNYLDDYNKFKHLIAEKYGATVEDGVVWKKDSPYQDDPESWEFAVRMGYLVYSAKWETKTTNIFLLLQGEDLAARLSIVYESRQAKSSLSQAEEERIKSDL